MLSLEKELGEERPAPSWTYTLQNVQFQILEGDQSLWVVTRFPTGGEVALRAAYCPYNHITINKMTALDDGIENRYPKGVEIHLSSVTGDYHVQLESRDQTFFLQNLARRTWAFFETVVGPDDHWLPPDNCQEHPVAAVAHRTSPTNMGLALLANLTAYDFGYIPAGQLIRRTSDAVGAMLAMERHEGHFYNWYDTQSLKPMPPQYVSAVDSGNLAGHLMTLRQGLIALADEPIVGERWLEGLGDTLRILAEVAGEEAPRIARLQTRVVVEAAQLGG